ncbi:MAG TPA: Gfo/Idh/MocA family oxidoreductase [Aggregatilineales bacterium]|nr:Gfo/Idh/MocA family oxidoreductase [Aggregatilineales bacterium]
MSIRFAAIGANHNHIFNQCSVLLAAGAEMVWYFDDEPGRINQFAERYPQVPLARSIEEILEDESLHLIACSVIPDERAAIGIRAMQHGKDFLTSKPGFTTLEQLEAARRVQAETGKFYSVYFGERLGNPSTVKAGELVHAGFIGQVIQTTGFGPHRLLGLVDRPDWSFQSKRHGGILVDLASHQIDQFLYFTGSTSAELVASHIGNLKFHQFPDMEDFGDILLRSESATGYIRVDWLTPTGLGVWGDVRLYILGTEGYIELRKYIDIEGRPGSNHLFLVDGKTSRYIDCSDVEMPFARQFIQDILNRTETAMPGAHTFLASELALQAQAQAEWIKPPVMKQPASD